MGRPDDRLARLTECERVIEQAQPGDPDLGPLQDLPGQWNSEGQGWNMIALPYAEGPFGYRLLLNQYNETLKFELVDKAVPNRGIDNANQQSDQRIVTLDYEQVINQVAVIDEPQSSVTGQPGSGIHHEPGLFLNMVNLVDDGINIGRLATIPHGDAVLALGTSSVSNNPPTIPQVDGLPVGATHDLENDKYLGPYAHFHANPFKGTVTTPNYPGFDPTQPHKLLEFALQGVQVMQTTTLDLDTSTDSGGIHNIPFIIKQANATSMKSTFWIEKLHDGSLQLQYLQIVMLDFFPRVDGLPGLIGWPHVSINTLTKT